MRREDDIEHINEGEKHDTEEERKGPVVLNIYELLPSPDQEGCSRDLISFFSSKVLPKAGMGAYHTSIDVDGYCYAYGIKGLAKVVVANKHNHKPQNALYKEYITLGNIELGKGLSSEEQTRKINKCLNFIHQHLFSKRDYHIMNRNCNHFTEILANALILADDLKLEHPPELDTYPNWINRLARTGSGFVNIQHGNGNDGVSIPPANVLGESKLAARLGLKDAKIAKLVSPSPKKKKKSKTRKQSYPVRRRLATDGDKVKVFVNLKNKNGM